MEDSVYRTLFINEKYLIYYLYYMQCIGRSIYEIWRHCRKHYKFFYSRDQIKCIYFNGDISIWSGVFAMDVLSTKI